MLCKKIYIILRDIDSIVVHTCMHVIMVLYETYRVFKTNTWWLFFAKVTTYPSLEIFRPQHRLTFTYGHSNSLNMFPSREKTATWNLFPWLSPTKTSPKIKILLSFRLYFCKKLSNLPASLTSIPFGKFVIFSPPIRLKNWPS